MHLTLEDQERLARLIRRIYHPTPAEAVQDAVDETREAAELGLSLEELKQLYEGFNISTKQFFEKHDSESLLMLLDQWDEIKSAAVQSIKEQRTK